MRNDGEQVLLSGKAFGSPSMMMSEEQAERIAKLDDGTKARATRQQSFRLGGSAVRENAPTTEMAIDFTSSTTTQHNPGAGQLTCALSMHYGVSLCVAQ